MQKKCQKIVPDVHGLRLTMRDFQCYINGVNDGINNYNNNRNNNNDNECSNIDALRLTLTMEEQ